MESEGKEVRMVEGSRIIEDFDSEAEEFKCEDFEKQEMELLPLFCSWTSLRERRGAFVETADL